jgi:hypothetical protein
MKLHIRKIKDWHSLYDNDFFKKLLSFNNVNNIKGSSSSFVFDFDVDILDNNVDILEKLNEYIKYILPRSYKELILNINILPGDVLNQYSISGLTKSKVDKSYDSQSYVLVPFNFYNKSDKDKKSILAQVKATIIHEAIHQSLNKSKERQQVIKFCRNNNISKELFLDIEEYFVESIIKNKSTGLLFGGFQKSFGLNNKRNQKIREVIVFFKKQCIQNNELAPVYDVDNFLKIKHICEKDVRIGS